jgi:hypothetical protein
MLLSIGVSVVDIKALQVTFWGKELQAFRNPGE